MGVDSKVHGAHMERLPLLASEGTNRNEGHEMIIMHIRHEGERLCLLIQHLLELLEAEDAVAVLVELGEDGLDLVLVELLGHLGELVLGDVAVVVLVEDVEGALGLRDGLLLAHHGVLVRLVHLYPHFQLFLFLNLSEK